MPLDAPRRKTFLMNPGETLLVPTSAGDTLARGREFAETTGLDFVDDLVSPTSTAIPLPVYREAYGEGHTRIPGWKTELLWHPLAWLPRDFVFRYELIGEGDERTVEPDELWAVRVCLTLQEHGLYDATTGTWLDILSAFDIDIDDPEDRARVQAWTDGGADDVLDSIADDVDALINEVNDDDWPFQAALAVAPDVLATSWGMLARSLKADFDMLTQSLVDGSAESVADVAEDLSAVATMASTLLGEMPASVALRGEPAEDDTEPLAFDYWVDLHERLADASNSDVATAIDELNDSLDRIIAFSEPYRESLYDFDRDAAGDPTPALAAGAESGQSTQVPDGSLSALASTPPTRADGTPAW